MKTKKYVLITALLLLSSCICDLDDLSTMENLEDRASIENGSIRTQHVDQFRHSTRLVDRYKEIQCTDNEIMEAQLFGKGLLYDLGPDRSDWNKLGGYYFKTFQPHGESILIAFRSSNGFTEYTFYYHGIKNKEDYKAVGSVPGYVDESNILSIKWDDNENASTYTKFYIQILNKQDIHVRLEDKDGNYIEDIVSFEEVRRNFSRGNLYHGGNMPAQDKITAVKAIY